MDILPLVNSAGWIAALGLAGRVYLGQRKLRLEEKTQGDASDLLRREEANKLVNEIMAHLRDEAERAHQRLQRYETLQPLVEHLEEALRHITALLESSTWEEWAAAEKAALAFLGRIGSH